MDGICQKWIGDFKITRNTSNDYFVVVNLGGNWCIFRNKWDNPELIDYYPSSDESAEEKAKSHCQILNRNIGE